jgi:RNA polymerase-interacting CarD/CdnL/TRCF family regulator
MKQERPKPKLGPFRERIGDILKSNRALPKKKSRTAKRVYERSKEEGYQGKYTQAKEVVRELKRQSRGFSCL